MGYLQLADNRENDIYSALAENPMDNYIFVPTDESGAGKWVREDYFDALPPLEYEQLMDFLEPFQNPGVNGIFSKIRANMKARREARRERKTLKSESKATARIQRTAGGGFMDKIGGLVGNIFGNTPIDAGFDVQTGKAPEFYARGDTKWFQTTGGKIGIGVAVVVIGGVIYKLSTKK